MILDTDTALAVAALDTMQRDSGPPLSPERM